MFPQVLQREDYAKPKQYSKHYANNTPSSYRIDGRIAGRGIEEGTVEEQGRLVLVESEPAVRPVRQCAVAI